MKYFFLILLGFLYLNGVKAQSWSSVRGIGSLGQESVSQVAAANGRVAIAGTFTNQLIIGLDTLISKGEDDLFWVVWNSDGTVLYSGSAGGPQDDEVNALHLSSEGNLTVAGLYRDALQLPDTLLQPVTGNTALFVLRLNADSQLDGLFQLAGSGIERWGGIDYDTQGRLGVSGYFEQEVQVLDTQWVATGQQDAFVAILDTALDSLLWVKQVGEGAFVRGTDLVFSSTEQWVLAGAYEGAMVLQGDSLQSSQPGNDLFLASWNSDGEALWYQTLVGAQEDQAVALWAGPQSDKVWLAGTLRGRLRTRELLEIQSADLNEDGFVYAVNTFGQTEVFSPLNDPGTEQVTDMYGQDGYLYLCGYFSGSFQLGSTLLDAPAGDIFGFVARYDTTGQFGWLTGMNGEGLILPEAVAVTDAEVFVGGSFNQTLGFLTPVLNSKGGFDGFLSILSPVPVSVQRTFGVEGLKIYPNPARKSFRVEGLPRADRLQVVGLDGQLRVLRYLRFERVATTTLYTEGWPAGWYVVTVWKGNRCVALEKVLVVD